MKDVKRFDNTNCCHKSQGEGETGGLIARVGRTNWRERRAGNANSEHTASRRFVGMFSLGPSAARTTAWLMTNTQVSFE